MKFHPHVVALACTTLFVSEALRGDAASTSLEVTRPEQPGNDICLVAGVAPLMETRSAVASEGNVEARRHFRPPYDDTVNPNLTCSSLAAASRFELIKGAANDEKFGKVQRKPAILSITPPN